MTFTSDEIRAIKHGEPVEIVPPEIGEQCVAVRKDVYQRMAHPTCDDSEIDPAGLYAIVGRIMAEDDANDPALESYQKYKQ